MAANRRLRVMTALFLAAVMVFSLGLLLLEADHDCAGEDCAVCAVLAACESVLRLIAAVCVLRLFAALRGGRLRGGDLGFGSRVCRSSPVLLRVKLSD